jgi:hypothetical protein
MNNDYSWIKELKKGDKLYYKNRWSAINIVVVDKITPTGKIRLENGNLTDSKGYLKSGSVWDGGNWLKPISQEILDEIKQRNIAGKLKNFDFSKLDLNTLVAIDILLTR